MNKIWYRSEQKRISENTNKRDPNFELMRIVSMAMIVAHHYAVHGIMSLEGRTDYSIWREGMFLNKVFSSVMLPGGGVGIALFFMITGYFAVNNEEHLKLKKIVVTSVFYGWFAAALYVLAYCLRSDIDFYGQFRNAFISMLSPVTGGAWWYVTTYFWLALLSPTINRMIRDLSNRKLGICVVIVGLFGYAIDFHTGTKFIDLQRAIFFYLMGCFYRRSMNKKASRHISFLFFVITWMIISALLYHASSIDTIGIVDKIIVKVITSINSFVVTPVCAFCAFDWFARYERAKSIDINRIAKTTFGIYLFHDSFIAQILIWNVIFDVKNVQFMSNLFPLYAISTVSVVFIVGSIVDVLREKFANPIFERIYCSIVRSLGFIN